MTSHVMRRRRPIVSALAVAIAAFVASPISLAQSEPVPAPPGSEGLMPTEETGAARFLEEHPQYDGRGVIIAIFDTGVDPGADGLQVTSDGKRKIIDMVDATGDGDVDMSKTVKPDDAGAITGLSGRTLTLDPGWTNPSGEYRIGLKAAYEFFPGGLVGRLQAERRKDFVEINRPLLAEAKNALLAFDEAHPTPTSEELEQRKDLKARVALLEAAAGKWDDPGPVYDCIVFNDGERWRAVIDTDEDGDLADELLMTDYRVEHQYGTFGEEDLLNFAVNIYGDGEVLSIVVDSGAHGTHVAGITAAHFPDEPDLNGVAPGAQIVAVKIGDARLGSTSTNTGLARGAVAVLRSGADLINMSYGGPTGFPNQGAMNEVIEELVNEQGVIFVASAGNAGPALSTIGGPGGTSTAIIGVGAAISSRMMADQYSLRDAYGDLQYSFSSRGPASDGALGVSISGPGGAIAPVPNWVLQRNMLMNGTSMSAPNVCGSIALLLSGMKDRGVKDTPHLVRRAIENTARDIPDATPWAAGQGMIQVDEAWGYLMEHAGGIDDDIWYKIDIPTRNHARGFYLREPFENDTPVVERVYVTPMFREEADNRAKVEFDLPIELETSESWIEAPPNVRMMHGGRRFEVRVDPRGLGDGAHYGEVRGYDARNRERGVLFRVPVTVIKGERVREGSEWTAKERISTEAGRIDRRFLEVPMGATWADIVIRRLDEEEGSRLLVIQLLQMLDNREYTTHHVSEYSYFEPGQERVFSMRVSGPATLEAAVTQYWSSLGDGEFEISVAFHGIEPSSGTIVLDGSSPVTTVDVAAPFRPETLSPKGAFTDANMILRPTSTTIRPLDAVRDRLPRGQQMYELLAEFSFTLDDRATLGVVPAVSTMPDVWEEYQSLTWTVFDKNGRAIVSQTGKDEKATLAKGDYTLRYHLRHLDPSSLEAVKDQPVMLVRPLGRSVSVSGYAQPRSAAMGGRPMRGETLPAGDSKAVYIATPDVSGLPKWVEPGMALTGTMTFGEDAADLEGPGARPKGWPMMMVVPPAPTPEKEPTAKREEPKDERTAEEKLNESIRDLKIERLAKLTADDESELAQSLYDELRAEWSDHLPLHLAWLDRMAGKHMESDPDAVIDAAQRVIDRVDGEAIAAALIGNVDPDDVEAREAREDAQEQKAALVEALRQIALARLQQAEQSGEAADVQAFDEAVKNLERWQTLSLGSDAELMIGRETLHGRTAAALELVREQIEDEPFNKEHRQRMMDLIGELGWEHWSAVEARRMLRHYPPSRMIP